MSTAFGVAAQLKESHDDAQKAYDDGQRALELANENNNMLHDIRRGLHPLDGLVVDLDFDVPCVQERYAAFCEDVTRQHKDPVWVDSSNWIGWPRRLDLGILIYLFRDRAAALLAIKGTKWGSISSDGDLSMLTLGRGLDRTLAATPEGDGQVTIHMIDRHPVIQSSTGEITSILDLPGTTVVLCVVEQGLYGLDLTQFELRTKNGEKIEAKGSEFKWSSSVTMNFYTYTFPSVPKSQSNGSSAVPIPVAPNPAAK
jgi:hypothetical protein